MILSGSLTIDWIQSRVQEFKRSDPIIVEKVIRDLVLLETLKSLKLDFIFKGGTALMLIIQEPKRFSIVINKMIKNKEQDVEIILNKVVEATDFIGWEEQKQKNKSIIDKRHFELQYNPHAPMLGEINYIVFEENPYTETQNIEVSHFLVLEDDSPVEVTVPTLSAILGDNWCAFIKTYGSNETGL